MDQHFPSDSYSVHFAAILAIFEISNLIVSLVMANYMGSVKRKRLII